LAKNIIIIVIVINSLSSPFRRKENIRNRISAGWGGGDSTRAEDVI
jgi:hypothetical protein